MTKVHFEWLARYIAEYHPKCLNGCDCRHDVITLVCEMGVEFNEHFSEGRFFEYLHNKDREYAGTDGSQR